MQFVLCYMKRFTVLLAIMIFFIFSANVFAERNEDDWLSFWSVDTFVDDFGDPTNKKFIQTRTQGTFSNSATTNSACNVTVTITKDHVGIFLYEYNRQQAAYFIGDDGVVQMKNDAGITKDSHVLGKWSKNGGIQVSRYSVVEMLKRTKGFVKFVIHDGYSSVYRFSINANGFIDALNKL